MWSRNIKTGAVVEALGIISGKDWEELPSGQPEKEAPAEPVKKEKTTKTKRSRK